MCASMAIDDQLSAEARERPRAAIFAGLAALFTLIAAVVGILSLSNEPDNLPGSLIYRNQHVVGLSVSAAASLLGSLAIAYVLDFLFRATRARNPSVPSWLRLMPWIGGVGLAIIGIVIQVVLGVKLAHFATHGTQTYDEAKHVLTSGDYNVVRYLGIVPQLALALALVMISLNAMRVGLLTRFLGYLGIIAAVLFVIPLVPIPIVQIYWLGALAWMFAGRSRTGDPAAWQSGEAVPWPSSQEMREARVRAAEERRGGRRDGAPAAAAEESAKPELLHAPVGPTESDDHGDAADAFGSSGAARRKRKKRR
ncbi:MAG: hypothetical protein JWQ48_2982 [Conexibacter sp.]|nr:hypothetical protein [Conexibacter sp.]